MFTAFTQAGDDVLIRDTIEDPIIDLIASDFGQASDEAVAAVASAESRMNWINGFLV